MIHNGTIVQSFLHKISVAERIFDLVLFTIFSRKTFLILSSNIYGLLIERWWCMHRRRIKVIMRECLETWSLESWFSSSEPSLQSLVTQFITKRFVLVVLHSIPFRWSEPRNLNWSPSGSVRVASMNCMKKYFFFYDFLG